RNIYVGKCQNCSLAAVYDVGLHISTTGLTVGDVHNTTFAAMGVGGAYEANPAILVTSKASNILFTDVTAWNGFNGTSPGATNWLEQSGATNITYNQCQGRD